MLLHENCLTLRMLICLVQGIMKKDMTTVFLKWIIKTKTISISSIVLLLIDPLISASLT